MAPQSVISPRGRKEFEGSQGRLPGGADTSVGPPDLADKKTGFSVKFEFQIKMIAWDVLTLRKLVFIVLKF